MTEKQKILIVDDRKENLVALRQVLNGVGAEIVEATNGNQALAATLDHDFAVAILDVMMPGMSGYDLAGSLRKDNKTKVIPIIFVTASYADEQHMFKGYEAGGIDYIVKPYTPEVLVGKVRVFLEMDFYRRELRMHRDHLERVVADRTSDLKERVKEIACLYAVSSLVAEPRESIDEMLKLAADLIPPGWQYPEITCARITFGGREFATANFRDTAWKQSADIVLSGETVGAVNVCYLEDRPELDEGPFLKEERDLIGDIARQLGVLIHRERVLQALRKSESTYRMLVEKLPQKIFLKDSELVYISCNRNYSQDLGIAPEEIPGKTDFDFYPRELADKYRADDQRIMAAGRVEELEERYVQNGKQTWVHTVKTPVRDDHGNVTGILGIFWDITTQKQLEEQSRQSQKLEAIGLLAGGVAHDFNNILMVMMGHCDLMEESIRPEDPMARDIAQIKAAGQRAAALTRHLLAFSRKQTLQPQVLDINTVVAGLEEMLRSLIGEDLDFVTAFGKDLGRVKADRGQIEQVIMNLVVNARDAMPQGGKLTIETANVNLDKEYAKDHVSVVPGPYVMLAVTDTGCGMDKKTKSRIFDPFFTTKENGKGTGLGLSTVYGIVKQSGGNIWVYSEPGKGTTFKIYLPRTEDEPVAEAEGAEEELRGGGEQILLVEDEPALRDLFEKMLERLDYKVTVAANGREALLAIEEKGLKPDLVITDVVMPGMSGVVLAERLRKSLPDLKVLYVSGYTDNTIVNNGLLNPDMPFMQKPFSIADLASKTNKLLQGRATRMSKHILMIDDDADARTLVHRACTQRGHVFVGVGTSAAALESLAGEAFDVLLVDMNIPGTDGARVLQEIRAAGHLTPAIALSGDAGSVNIGLLRPLGVVKAVEKSGDLHALVDTLERMGRTY